MQTSDAIWPKFDFSQRFALHTAYASGMNYFNSAAYSPRVYARFRSSLALERFVCAPHDADRATSLRWAHAWLLVVKRVKCADDELIAAATRGGIALPKSSHE